MKVLKVAAVLESISAATEFIDALLEEHGCPTKAQMQIDIAIDELLANISHYAYAPGTGDAEIGYDYDEASRTVSVMFKDSGIPFNPLEQKEPDIKASLADRKPGGLGIFMVRKTMDEMEYRRENGYNILIIRKKI